MAGHNRAGGEGAGGTGRGGAAGARCGGRDGFTGPRPVAGPRGEGGTEELRTTTSLRL